MNDRLHELTSWVFVEDEKQPNFSNAPSCEQEEPISAITAKKQRERRVKQRKTKWGLRQFRRRDFQNQEGDLEMNNTSAQSMQAFYRQVALVRGHMQAVKDASESLVRLHEKAMQATTSEQETKIPQKIRALVDETNKRAMTAKTTLEVLRHETQTLQNDPAITASQSDLRARESITNAMTQTFIDQIKIYQAAQQKYKDDMKQKATRQVQIVKPSATPEDIDAVIRSVGGRDALYQSMVLTGSTANHHVHMALMQVADKYQDILALEQSLTELHHMFLDLALLAESQGEVLDVVEFHVKGAASDVQVANEQIVKSITFQQRIRKKQCWIISFVLILVAAIVVFFLL